MAQQETNSHSATDPHPSHDVDGTETGAAEPTGPATDMAKPSAALDSVSEDEADDEAAVITDASAAASVAAQEHTTKKLGTATKSSHPVESTEPDSAADTGRESDVAATSAAESVSPSATSESDAAQPVSAPRSAIPQQPKVALRSKATPLATVRSIKKSARNGTKIDLRTASTASLRTDAELQSAITQLRQSLGGPTTIAAKTVTATTQPSRERRMSRWTLLLAGAVVLSMLPLIVGLALDYWKNQEKPSPLTASGPPPAHSAIVMTPRTGNSLQVRESFVDTRNHRAGALRIPLTVPPAITATASAVQVTADNKPVAVSGSGAALTAHPQKPFRTLEIRYILTRSTTAVTSAAIGVPLLTRQWHTDAAAPTTIEVTGDRTAAVSCLAGNRLRERLCASQQGVGTWTAETTKDPNGINIVVVTLRP